MLSFHQEHNVRDDDDINVKNHVTDLLRFLLAT